MDESKSRPFTVAARGWGGEWMHPPVLCLAPLFYTDGVNCVCIVRLYAVNPLIFMALYSHNPGAATGSSQVLKHGTSAKFVHDAMQKILDSILLNWDCAL